MTNAERGDVAAYLRRRIANHRKVEGNATGSQARAGVCRRELELVLGDIEAGMHEGEAMVSREIARREGEG